MKIDPDTIEDTLVQRIARDCNDAVQHLSVHRILGALESVKMMIYIQSSAAINAPPKPRKSDN